jgi:uracil-DNA glycosylase
MTFQEFLTKWFGKRIQELTVEKIDGLHFVPDKIHQNYAPNQDKCQKCSARIFRQDIPFWLGSHTNKKLMVIAQDAGKGEEDYGLNTVFSIHNAHTNIQAYFEASHRHKGYYDLFRDLIGNENFLEYIYFTDIVKCAYSTFGKVAFSETLCKDELFFEIQEVNPEAILLMGKPAQNAFKSLSLQFGNTFEEILTNACSINSRGSVSFTHYKVAGKNIFFIPHLIGNLHIAKENKETFEIFKSSLIAYIHSTIS